MDRQKRLSIASLGVLLLVAGLAAGRFLLLPANDRTYIEIPGDPANAQMWLRLQVEPDTTASFDILDLDIARNTTGPTRCYSSLIFSQETPYPFTTHPADFFAKSSPTDGYSRSYTYHQETGIQGQTANYDLLNVCDSVNPHLSTFNSARILAPAVAANADTRRLLVGAMRNRYFYPFDKYTISFAGISLAGIVLDSQPVERATLSPAILLETDAPEWQVTATSHISEWQEVQSELTLKRPAATRLLAVAVLSMTLGFIPFLGFLKSNTDFFGAAIGILLGLWGIRDVLLPGFVTWTTIVDRFIVLCYLLLAIVLVARYTWRRVFRQDEETSG